MNRVGPFDFTKTTDVPPEQLDDAIQEELEALHKAAIEYPRPQDPGVMPTTVTHLSRLLSLLAIQTSIDTKKIVKLTWALFYLTVALALVAAVQVFIILSDSP